MPVQSYVSIAEATIFTDLFQRYFINCHKKLSEALQTNFTLPLSGPAVCL